MPVFFSFYSGPSASIDSKKRKQLKNNHIFILLNLYYYFVSINENEIKK